LKVKNINYKKACLKAFTVMLCFLAVSCKKDSADSESAMSGTLVKPSYNRSSMFRNPLNGWVMYASASGNPSYWDTQFYVPDLGKTVKAIDYASACYIRASW